MSNVITAEIAVARNEDPASIHRVADWHAEAAECARSRASLAHDDATMNYFIADAVRHEKMADRLRRAAVVSRRMMNENAAHAD